MATPTIDAMILGALHEHPMSAYEMNKMMDQRGVRSWARISSPSVYRNLVQLYKQGYVESTTVKDSAMPERTVYSITLEGKERLHELLYDIASSPARVDFNFVSVIANIRMVDEKMGHELLQSIADTYSEWADRLEQAATSIDEQIEAKATLELCSDTYRLIADWARKFEKDFYQNRKK